MNGLSKNNERMAAFEQNQKDLSTKIYNYTASVNNLFWFLYISVPVLIIMLAKIMYDVNYIK